MLAKFWQQSQLVQNYLKALKACKGLKSHNHDGLFLAFVGGRASKKKKKL